MLCTVVKIVEKNVFDEIVTRELRASDHLPHIHLHIERAKISHSKCEIKEIGCKRKIK